MFLLGLSELMDSSCFKTQTGALMPVSGPGVSGTSDGQLCLDQVNKSSQAPGTYFWLTSVGLLGDLCKMHGRQCSVRTSQSFIEILLCVRC